MIPSEAIPILTAAVSGAFLVTAYLVQKTLEHRRAIADKRRDAYSSFLKATFESIEARRKDPEASISDEVFWKAQVILFGSDAVIVEMGKLMHLLPNTAVPDYPEKDVAEAFDRLLLAMRRDTRGLTRLTMDDIRRCSPILLEDAYQQHAADGAARRC